MVGDFADGYSGARNLTLVPGFSVSCLKIMRRSVPELRRGLFDWALDPPPVPPNKPSIVSVIWGSLSSHNSIKAVFRRGTELLSACATEPVRLQLDSTQNSI